MAAPANLDVLDLRHFTASQLRPLLRDQATRWQRRLLWDYHDASEVLLDYIDDRVLPGFVAIDPAHGKRILGYCFCVLEAAKAVIGDIYAFHESEAVANPVCELLLEHMLDMLQATPGVDRIESQLLMFPFGAFAPNFQARHFRSFARLFMSCGLSAALQPAPDPSPHRQAPPPHLVLTPWQPGFYAAAAELIHRCYARHMDSHINDQYQTVPGAQRFLHNIIRFPGCGTFDARNSWVIRDPRTPTLHGLLLCSRIRPDVAHITQLCIDPPLQGQGLGQTLLRQAITGLTHQGLASLSLTVTEANSHALNLYHQFGFSTLHRFQAWVWNENSAYSGS